jgi:predicted nucleic acid-binding protein
MKYVIDCSVAFKWVVPEVDSAKAIQLRDNYRNNVDELLVPDIFPAEISNAILVAGWRGRVPAGQGPLLVRDVLNTCPGIHPSLPDLLPRAYEIAE